VVDEEGNANDGISHGGEHQRAAECCADADVLRRPLAEHHGDKGDDAFRQGRAEGGEHGADGAAGHAEAKADPFHAVDEVFAGEVDDNGGGNQKRQGEGHGRPPNGQVKQAKTVQESGSAGNSVCACKSVME
jgi:hypothetical protein